jgi:hypothetical protein
MATRNAQRGRPALSKAEKARRQKARAEGKPVVTKISQAREIFSNFLPKVGELGSVEFRRQVVKAIAATTKSSPATAATMYNTCKTEAETDGRLRPGQVGMKARGGIEIDPEVSWVVLQVTPVAQHTSRDAAKAASGPGQRVMSTKAWLNEVGDDS